MAGDERGASTNFMVKNNKTDSLYCIEFIGTIQEGWTLDGVKANLGKLFQTEDAGKIDQLFRNTPKILKRNLSREQALKYQQRFEKTGAYCRILEEGPQSQAPAKLSTPVQASWCSTTRALSPKKPRSSRVSDAIPRIVYGSIFLFFAIAFMGVTVGQGLDEVRSYTVYQPGLCKIRSKRILEHHDEDGTSYEPIFEFHVRTSDREQLAAASGYTATPRYFSPKSRAEAILKAFELEESYECWYDPDQPSKAVLFRDDIPWGEYVAFTLVPLIIAFFGIVMIRGGVRSSRKHVRQRGMSDEAKVMMEKASPTSFASQDAFVPLKPAKNYNVAVSTAITATVLALLLNGFAASLVVIAAKGVPRDVLPLFAGFLIPFLIAGFFVTRWAWREWTQNVRAGKTEATRLRKMQLELYGGGLFAGREAALRLRQAGEGPIQECHVTLKGVENIAYTEGTDIMRQEHLFFEETVMQIADVSISRDNPLEQECTVCLPPDTMHSFKAKRNEIAWSFVVSITTEEGSEVKKGFPVQVAQA